MSAQTRHCPTSRDMAEGFGLARRHRVSRQPRDTYRLEIRIGWNILLESPLDSRTDSGADGVGLFQPRYVAFLETVSHLRSRMHRYCARMTGSAMDGEDVMQEALFEAYQKLEQFDNSRPLKPWLFRIVHNRCIDFLRRRQVREDAEATAVESLSIQPVEPLDRASRDALELLVVHLPPKERACVLLKDVFDYSLEETAELVDSTVGGVKAALNRGRGKLVTLQDQPKAEAANPAALEVLRLYVERFNRHDWDGVRELASADARLRVADCFAGRLADSPYFIEYERRSIPWHMALGVMDGEDVVIIMRDDSKGSSPLSVIRMEILRGHIVSITDYVKCSWLIDAAVKLTVR
jgi:RNA polymerase sigma-70 factor (ECF subfamily)